MKIFMLFTMIFLQIVDDYYLQGILAQLKQKEWWNEHAPQPMYRYDYIIALIEHSFSWAFMVMLPIMICIVCTERYDLTWKFVCAFIVNVAVHALIDDLKANRFKINLTQDQCLHVLWIVLTWFSLVVASM